MFILDKNMYCYIDFETRSEVDLKTHGAWAYSAHPSTEIICVSLYYDKPYSFDLLSNVKSNIGIFKNVIDIINLCNGDFVAHNAFFEYCIFTNILHRRFGFDYMDHSRFICTMAEAALSGLPRSLAGVCFALGSPIEKDAEGRRLMLKMCKPRKPTKTDKSKWHETKEDIERLIKYCETDVLATKEIHSKIDGAYSNDERNIWLLDQKINTKGIYIDFELIKSAINLLNENITDCNSEIERLTDGQLKNVNSRSQVLLWAKSKGVELLSFTKDYLSKIVKEDIDETVKRVLEIRLMLGKTSTAKFKAFYHMTCDNRIRGTLLYHGAFTGRWAGRGIQPQNLPRGNEDLEDLIADIKQLSLKMFKSGYDNPMEALSMALRGAIIAPESKELLVADYNAIEARVLLWLANDEKSLQLFKDNQDLYVDMAASIYNKDSKDITKSERQLGKTAILGLGYGMGAMKFMQTCLTKGITIDEEFAHEIVLKYRQKYKAITHLWKITGEGFKECISAKGDMSYFITYDKMDTHKYSINGNSDRITIILPSSRKLIYHTPKLVKEKKPWGMSEQITYQGVSEITHTWEVKRTWGGELVQNVTQAIARDVMAYAMLKLDRAGFDLVMTVHDELIAEGKDLDTFVQIMSQPPEWASSLPLKVEGWKGKRYHK